jgi:crossover junction endodeoxyribonuclease RusA
VSRQETMTVELPFPPSVNGYWRSFRGRQIISAKGRQYRDDVQAVVLCHPRRQRFTGRLRVLAELWVPDKRRRDVDNSLKAILDSVTHAGLWDDDEQIDDLRIVRAGVRPGGAVVLTIASKDHP